MLKFFPDNLHARRTFPNSRTAAPPQADFTASEAHAAALQTNAVMFNVN